MDHSASTTILSPYSNVGRNCSPELKNTQREKRINEDKKGGQAAPAACLTTNFFTHLHAQFPLVNFAPPHFTAPHWNLQLVDPHQVHNPTLRPVLCIVSASSKCLGHFHNQRQPAGVTGVLLQLTRLLSQMKCLHWRLKSILNSFPSLGVVVRLFHLLTDILGILWVTA